MTKKQKKVLIRIIIAAVLYSLADFVDEDGTRIRKDESYEKNYLIGKYGAIPTLKSIDIFKED